MQKIIKTYFILTLVFVLCNSLNAQNGTVKIDSSEIETTYFKENFKDAYSSSDFDYTINDTDGINLIQLVFSKFFRWVNDTFGVDLSFISYQLLEIIVYSLLGIIVLYLIIKFLLQSSLSTVFKTETKPIDGFSYIEEDIQQQDFDKLLNNALKENNYRLATRYLYLKSLKILSQNNTIHWHFEKTNSDYLNEIQNDKLKSLFKRVSYIYDYVWYGEFPINEESFNKNKDDFNNLINTSKNG